MPRIQTTITEKCRIAKENLIFLCKHGSHAYGTALPTSDMDHRGLFIAPPEFICGLREFEQYEAKYNEEDPDEDTVIWELNKFIGLAAECNPNIIEVLFIHEDDILVSSREYQLLRENAKIFLSRKAKDSFSGYAFNQLDRIKGHKKWINNPQPEVCPSIEDFHDFFNSKQLYQEAKLKWKQYWKWKRDRNPARAALEEKFGFDTKHAMHLVRLMRMAEEILRDGEVHVKRPDARELLLIREGTWSYDDLIKWAEEKDAELGQYTSLPEQPDYLAIERLMLRIRFMYWNRNLSNLET